MSDEPAERPAPADPPADQPLDQTTAPIEFLQEDAAEDVPLDQTRSEMRPFLGSQDSDSGHSKHRRS